MTAWFPLGTAPALGAVTGGSLWTGGSLVVALVAGLVALLAPCCVSVMLPAYLSAAYHANDYGMMGTSEDGHSFVLVGRTARSSGGPTSRARRTTPCTSP